MAKNYYLLMLILFFSIGISTAQSGNTSNARTDVAKTYTNQIGIRELTGHNDGKFVEIYLSIANCRKVSLGVQHLCAGVLGKTM